MPLRQQLSDSLGHIQERLFPWLREAVGPLTEDHERLVTVLAMARIEAFVQMHDSLPGRPLKDRHALTRALVAKAVLDLPTTAMLIERLAVDATLRRLCGWACAGAVPSEATFSRAFAELTQFVASCSHLVAPEGALAAMKGLYPRDELAKVSPGFDCSEVVALAVPLLNAERHLVLCHCVS